MSSWHCKPIGGYEEDSTEARDNVLMMASFLRSKGWTLNAIAGLAGNQNNESAYNPWRWEADITVPSYDYEGWHDPTFHGYGLFQFTPASKYIESSIAQAARGYGPKFSDVAGSLKDGEAQLAYIAAGQGGYYSTAAYPESLDEFAHSTKTPSYLAKAWLYNYERPGDPGATEAARAAAAERWYAFLNGTPIPSRTVPYWWIMRRRSL